MLFGLQDVLDKGRLEHIMIVMARIASKRGLYLLLYLCFLISSWVHCQMLLGRLCQRSRQSLGRLHHQLCLCTRILWLDQLFQDLKQSNRQRKTRVMLMVVLVQQERRKGFLLSKKLKVNVSQGIFRCPDREMNKQDYRLSGVDEQMDYVSH